MQEENSAVYKEYPADQPLLEEQEIRDYEIKFGVGREEITGVFDAVGKDREKMKAFFEQPKEVAVPKQSSQNETPEPAINPNPSANANIEDTMQHLSKNEKAERTQQPNNEITDGEDG